MHSISAATSTNASADAIIRRILLSLNEAMNALNPPEELSFTLLFFTDLVLSFLEEPGFLSADVSAATVAAATGFLACG